jgi:hypothetical protein
MKIKSILLAGSLLLTVLSSCKKDDEETGLSSGKILVSTMLPNPDGQSGSAYMQLMENMDSKSLTNSTAIPTPYGTPPIVCSEDVFVLPGYTGETYIMTKYSRENGMLVKQGDYTLPSQSGATNIVTKGDIAYISCALIGKVLVINHKTMQLVKEIDISSYGVGDQNPDPSSMLIRDNQLFVALTQMVGGYFPAPTRPYSDVLIINTDNNEVLKMITDSTSGISCPTRPIDPYSIFMDENKDIYIVGLGAWGALPGHKSGVLRIKAGETEFDKSYQFVFNSTAITGETNPLDYVHAVNYYGNGKLYGTANIPAYYGNPVNYITDRTVIPVEIDLISRIAIILA